MHPVEPHDEPTGAWKRITFAKDQPEYNPLPALVDAHGIVRTRWQLSLDERRAILDGACILLDVMTFGNAFQPVLMTVEGTDGLVVMPEAEA